MFAHGADSHIDDDLGAGSCGTEYWEMCSEVFAEWVNQISNEIGKPLPIILALFGGYRKDDYNVVLDLHTNSLIHISNIVCKSKFNKLIFIPRIKGEKQNKEFNSIEY